jgi:HPt (histidine-containing phosphotransfer) domain-containing protein
MTTPQQPGLTSALDRLWLQFRPQMEERMATLEAASTALAANSLSADQSSAAASAAHKLAGVLGTFGLARGTDRARELESCYSAVSPSASAQYIESLTAELRSLIAGR